MFRLWISLLITDPFASFQPHKEPEEASVHVLFCWKSPHRSSGPLQERHADPQLQGDPENQRQQDGQIEVRSWFLHTVSSVHVSLVCPSTQWKCHNRTDGVIRDQNLWLPVQNPRSLLILTKKSCCALLLLIQTSILSNGTLLVFHSVWTNQNSPKTQIKNNLNSLKNVHGYWIKCTVGGKRFLDSPLLKLHYCSLNIYQLNIQIIHKCFSI